MKEKTIFHARKKNILKTFISTLGIASRQRSLTSQAPLVQPKLTIGQPNDKYEQEADRMADIVMRMPEPKVQRHPEEGGEEDDEGVIQTKSISGQITPLIQRYSNEEDGENDDGDDEEKEEEDEIIQAKESSNSTPEVTPAVEANISAMKGGGQPLDLATRSFMEPRFGHDFSQVRVHTDANAAKSAQTIHALAYTVGNNIVFNSGQYAPHTNMGDRLIAHELTHTMQQASISDMASSNLAGTQIQRAHQKPYYSGLKSLQNYALGEVATVKNSINLILSDSKHIQAMQFEVYGGQLIKGGTPQNHVMEYSNALRATEKSIENLKSIQKAPLYGNLPSNVQVLIHRSVVNGSKILKSATYLFTATNTMANFFVFYMKELPLKGRKIKTSSKKMTIDVFKEVSKNPKLVKSVELGKLGKGLKLIQPLIMILAISRAESFWDFLMMSMGGKTRKQYLYETLERAIDVSIEELSKSENSL